MNIISMQSLLKSILKITADPGIAERNHDFDSLFIEAVYTKFNTGVIMDMQYAWELFRKGFEAAQKSNFGMATYYFDKGEESLSKSNFDETVLQYLKIYITPKRSYYHYKKQEYTISEELTWKALKETECIETEFPNMHMGKIQQLHNIARVLTKQNKHAEALDYETCILDYLLLHQLPEVPGVWSLEKLQRCDQELVSLMTFQVFSEKIVNLIAIPGINQQAALAYLGAFKDLVPQDSRSDKYRIYIKAINAFNGADVEEFITNMEEFFAVANAKFTAFKHHLILLYLSLIPVNSFDEATERLLIEALKSKIRVTPWMLGKYKSVFEVKKENISLK